MSKNYGRPQPTPDADVENEDTNNAQVVRNRFIVGAVLFALVFICAFVTISGNLRDSANTETANKETTSDKVTSGSYANLSSGETEEEEEQPVTSESETTTASEGLRDMFSIKADTRRELDESPDTMQLEIRDFTSGATAVSDSGLVAIRFYGTCENVGVVDCDYRALPAVKVNGRDAVGEIVRGSVRKGTSAEYNFVVTLDRASLGDAISVDVGGISASCSFSEDVSDIDLMNPYRIDGSFPDKTSVKALAKYMALAYRTHVANLAMFESYGSHSYSILDVDGAANGSEYTVSGKLRSDLDITGSTPASLSVLFFDADGNLVDYGTFTYDKPLEPGEVIDFEVHPNSGADRVVSYQIGEVFV